MPKTLADFVENACTFDPADSLLPFTVEGILAGWMKRSFAERLEEWPQYFTVRPRGVGMLGHFETPEHRSVAIAEVVESLAAETVISGWRGELVTVSESFHSPPLSCTNSFSLIADSEMSVMRPKFCPMKLIAGWSLTDI